MRDSELGPHAATTRTAAITAMGAYRVRAGQESGRWLVPWPGVLVEADHAADPMTLSAAAVQFGGPGVVLAGPTAAHLHGLGAAPPTPIHLMAPYGHWLRSRPGLRVHNGPLPDADRCEILGLPVLGFERTVTDLLCTERPDRALAVLDEALASLEPSRREPFRDAVDARLAVRRDPRGTRRAGLLLHLATGYAESPAESRLLWRVVDAGYPVPVVNWKLLAPDGREVYRLDLSWPEMRITIEYHGYAVHADRSAKDAARADDLRRRGWIVVEVWAADLASPGRYERELDDAFLRRGVDMGHRRNRVLSGRTHREPTRRGA